MAGEFLSDYNPGDVVIATADFVDHDLRTGHVDNIKKGETDVVESVSSDHHGGLQLNLVKNGRGWNNHVWRKLNEVE